MGRSFYFGLCSSGKLRRGSPAIQAVKYGKKKKTSSSTSCHSHYGPPSHRKRPKTTYGKALCKQTRPSWKMGQLELVVVVLSFRCSVVSSELSSGGHNKGLSRVTLCVAASSFVTLLAGGHIVLHYVTIIILHDAENALEFRGNGPYALLQFLLYIHETKWRPLPGSGSPLPSRVTIFPHITFDDVFKVSTNEAAGCCSLGIGWVHTRSKHCEGRVLCPTGPNSFEFCLCALDHHQGVLVHVLP